MDRRAVFFIGAAIIAAVLVPVTEEEHRFVPIALSLVYVVLAVASWADHRSKSRMEP